MIICAHNPREKHKLFLVAEKFSQGEILRIVLQIIKLGRMTALRKEDGRGSEAQQWAR